MSAICAVLFIVGIGVGLSNAVENCTWAKGSRNAEYPSYMKSKYIECLTQSIQETATEQFKNHHQSSLLSSVDYEVFGEGSWTPLKIPPGARSDGPSERVIVTIVDAELRQASPDSAAGTASMDGYFHFTWNDDRVKWQPSEWGQMRSIEIKPSFAENIWFPLFNVYPLKSKGSSQASELITPTVSYTGSIKAAVFLDWDANCDMDMRNYPYDSAKCRAQFEGQWVVDNNNINIVVAEKNMKKSKSYQQSYYWNYKSATISTVTNGSKQFVEILVEIDRVNTSAGIEILVPILIATIIAVLAPLFGSFKWQSVIKVIALLFMYLSLINFVQIHWVTRYSSGIPKLLEYHRFVMVVTVVALVISLFLWGFVRKSPSMPPPHWLSKLTERMATICVCTSVNVQDEGAETTTDDQWVAVLTSLNCVVFFVFLIIYILGTCIYCT